MAIFNKKKTARQVINRADGAAFAQDAKMQLASLLLTSLDI